MKKILYILILLLSFYKVYSQNYDLIVTITGDSIACHIDSITNTKFFFEMKVKNNWIHTYTPIGDITEYKRNEINKKTFVIKSGTTFIESLTEHNKNAVHTTIGFFLMYAAINQNYERLIWKSQDQLIHSIWIRVGIGTGTFFMDEGRNYLSTLSTLAGNKNSYLEISLGASLFGDYNYYHIYPAATIGYCYQKPNGRYVFRTGNGWPELFYLSFGICF